MTTHDGIAAQLVAAARQIAQDGGYPDLVNGLQPLERLLDKHEHEWHEFRERVSAYLQDPTNRAVKLPLLAEAADILYYAACIDAQDPYLYSHLIVPYVLRDLHFYRLEVWEVQQAALAKYAYRASGPGKKDAAIEEALISAALDAYQDSEQENDHGAV